MVRSEEVKNKKKAEVAALKELQSYMWSYRIVSANKEKEE
jgi:hypothetical protein